MRVHILKLRSVIKLMPLLGVLTACSMQAAFQASDVDVPQKWSDHILQLAPQQASQEEWWRVLNDPVLNRIVQETLIKNATLAEAKFRIDEARAQSDQYGASKLPALTANGNARRVHDGSPSADMGVPGSSPYSNNASLETRLTWELDLFGRVQQSVEASERRLDARTAEADEMKLAIASQVVNTALDLRACRYATQSLSDTITSLSRTLEMTNKRLSNGFSNTLDAIIVHDELDAKRIELAGQQEQCAILINALVSLSGIDRDEIRKLVALPEPGSAFGKANLVIPQAPKAALALPAKIVTHHPNVIAATQDAAAAWSDIAVARAERLPTIDLGAILTGQWIRAAGTVVDYGSWALGPSVAGKIFDGGAGSAKVAASQARYNQTASALQNTVRKTVEEIENALAAQQAANERYMSVSDAFATAQDKDQLNQNLLQQGMISQMDYEAAHRQVFIAKNQIVSAARDRVKAWVALVKATGNTLNIVVKR